MRQSYSPYRTKSGRLISENEIDAWVEEAERGYDPAQLRPHRVPIGSREPLRDDVVESETHPGTYYHLHLKGDGMWSCDCPGYQYRQECKHSRRKQEEKPW